MDETYHYKYATYHFYLLLENYLQSADISFPQKCIVVEFSQASLLVFPHLLNDGRQIKRLGPYDIVHLNNALPSFH